MKKSKFIIIILIFIVNYNSIAANINSWNYHNSPLPQRNIYYYAVDSTNQIWISLVYGGIFRTDTYTWQFLDTNNSDIPDYSLNKIIVDNKNNKWMGSSRGLIKYDDKTWELFNHENSTLPLAKYLFPIFVDKENNLWIVFRVSNINSGIIRFDGLNSRIFNDTNSGLLNNAIYTMAQDDDGSYWFSTEAGVVKYDGNSWQTIFKTPYNSAVWSICIDSAGTKYFTSSKRIIILKDDKFSYIDTSNTDYYYKSFGEIVRDKKNNLWVGTNTSLARFDGKDFKVVYGPAYNIKVDNHNNKWFMNYNEVLRCENLVVYNEDGLQGINGIEENYTNNDETQLIFPNPATDFIEISVGAGSEPALTGDVKIYDIFGQTLVSIRAGFEPAPTIQIDVSGLAPGLYFVRIGDKVSKFVKL